MTDKMEVFTVFVIDPGRGAFKMDFPNVPHTLPILQTLVGGYIERAPMLDYEGVDAWVNEEGLLDKLPPHWVGNDIYCGPVVFTRNDGKGGTVSLTPDDVAGLTARYAKKKK